MPHLPAEEAPGSPPLGQLMGRLAARVAVTLWRLVQAHQIVQEIYLSSTGANNCLVHKSLQALLSAAAWYAGAPFRLNQWLTMMHSVICEGLTPRDSERQTLGRCSLAGVASDIAVRQHI